MMLYCAAVAVNVDDGELLPAAQSATRSANVSATIQIKVCSQLELIDVAFLHQDIHPHCVRVVAARHSASEKTSVALPYSLVEGT